MKYATPDYQILTLIKCQTQEEIDFIEEFGGKMHAYEFKWRKASKARISKSFLKAYPENVNMIVSKENYLEYIQR